MRKRKTPYLSIVIPAYNEEENFKKGALDKVSRYLKKVNFPYEVIVVDDGSTDQTATLIKNYIKTKPAWRLIENPHQGKAAAVTTGILASSGQLILFTDFDQATPLREVEKLIKKIEKEGYQIAIGSREVKGAKRQREPFYRHLMGKAWNIFVQLILLRGIKDTQCGFKLFEKRVAHRLFSGLKVYRQKRIKFSYVGAFDVEVLFLARKLGYKIAEVPVNWHHVKTTRIHPIKDSLRMLRDLLRIRIQDLRGAYDKI